MSKRNTSATRIRSRKATQNLFNTYVTDPHVFSVLHGFETFIKKHISTQSPQGAVVYLAGSMGSGKTHILKSIADRISSMKHPTSVRYVTAEGFISELMDAIHKGRLKPFRRLFARKLLLIDDFHFLDEKLATQKELSRVIDLIIAHQGVVICAGSKRLDELKGFESSLMNHLEAGHHFDIGSPSVETMSKLITHKLPGIQSKKVKRLVKAIGPHPRQVERLALYLAGLQDSLKPYGFRFNLGKAIEDVADPTQL